MRARENPFRTERLQQLRFRTPARAGDAGPSTPVWSELEALEFRAAIVGPHGTGKTTLLREAGETLRAQGLSPVHWFLADDRPNPSVASMLREATALGPHQVLLFDGAGHLRPLVWKLVHRAARSAGGLIITDHVPGRLPTWVETASDPALLASLTQELLGGDRLIAPVELERLREECDGNLREVLLSLFDLSARDALETISERSLQSPL